MKKTAKPTWEEQNKVGFILNNFELMDNNIVRQIISKYDLQTSMCYMIILSHRNKETGKCFPTIELLARECSVSTRTIDTMIKKLIEGGFLIVDSGREKIANTYYFPKEKFYHGEGLGATRRSKGNFKNKNKNDN